MSRTPCVIRFPKILFAEGRHRVESILCQLRRQCLSVRRPWSMLQRRKQLLVKPGDHTLERKSIQCNIACHMSQNPPKMHPEAPRSATPLVTKEKAMRQMSESVPFLRGKKCCIGKKDGWYDPTLPRASPHPQIHWSVRLWDVQQLHPHSLCLYHSQAFLHRRPFESLNVLS